MRFDLEPHSPHQFPFDLASPDGWIIEISPTAKEDEFLAVVRIENISSRFIGFNLEHDRVLFNIKSTLAQVGIDAQKTDLQFDKARRTAEVKVILKALCPIGLKMLPYIYKGAYIGKLFAADPSRKVRDPDYLFRMFGRSDRSGNPLLSLGGLYGSNDLILDKVDGRSVAYLTLKIGRVEYDNEIDSFFPTLGKALIADITMREAVGLHQVWHEELPRNVEPHQLLLVKTLPLHIRTVYGKVVDELVSQGFHHTSASILQPDTEASGDIYEFYGDSKRELTDIPLEFYTLEPFREYVFFQDRDQLQSNLENPESLFKAFQTAPQPIENRAATFVVKGEQLTNLKEEDWITREPKLQDFPGQFQGSRQALMVERYIEQQPSYPFLKAIEDGHITSQGVLLTRYFPSPLLKRMLLSYHVQKCLKRIYFQIPSFAYQSYFSAEDRALLHDLEKFAIPTFWVDKDSGKILQYVQKPERDSGMFVPLDRIDKFLKATLFGIYGSNFDGSSFEQQLSQLMSGLIQLKDRINHPLFNKNTPLAMVTGGGPGAMEVGNKVAKSLDILSCANIVDFRARTGAPINEQKQNKYIDAKMTYRIDKLVERQAEFNLDFPIFLAGGIGTDFEYALEEVRRKIGSVLPTPVILMGPNDYWSAKITSRFATNLATGTIKGSEWISNSFYAIETAQQGLKIYTDYFEGRLPIGPNGPVYPEGFVKSTL